jgi:hypothetical protein
MAGPDLTAADIVAYPGLKLLLRASRRPEAVPLTLFLDGFETRFPGIAAWMQRVEQLPGYEKNLSAALAADVGRQVRLAGERRRSLCRSIQCIALSDVSVGLLNGE